MKNIHVLPTDKPSRLYKSKITQNISMGPIDISQHGDATYNLIIYITSDEEIKEGDWLFANQGVNKIVEIKEGNYPYGSINNKGDKIFNSKHWKSKIILTTDQDLIADGVQAIDDEFLEWFVKNPSCEYVEVNDSKVVKEHIFDGSNDGEIVWEKKIIIPQEEPKQDSTLENSKLALKEYILANKEKVTEDLQEMREKSGTGRDETLEEAALSFLPRSEVEHDTDFITGFEFGTNWMAERMYSEEELKNAIEISVAKALGVMSFTINEESFEQFKKK